MDEFIEPFPYCPNSVTAISCWKRLSGEIKLMVFVICVACWISLGKTGQWMKPAQVAVICGSPDYMQASLNSRHCQERWQWEAIQHRHHEPGSLAKAVLWVEEPIDRLGMDRG